MKAKKSVLKVALVIAILAAAITVAYGSQHTAKTSENVAQDKAVYTVKPATRDFNDSAVKVESSELNKEKALIRKEIEKNEKEKRAYSEKKPLNKKVAVKKAATKTVKPVETRKLSTTKTSVKPVSKNFSNSSAKTLTREEKILLEQKRAEQILAYYISKYPILKGVKIYVRDCPNNWQGCAYYTKGVILIDPDHTAPLEKIIAHEVKHILDWRTDGVIDNNDYHE